MLLKGISTSIKNKLFLLGIIPIILFVLLTVVYTLPSSRNDLFNEKEIQTKELVNVGLSVLTHYHSMESEGILSRRDAQQLAIQAVEALRFGEDMIDYYWITDYNNITVAHPFAKQLIGVDSSDLQDPNGVYFFREFLHAATTEGSGFVEYSWQYYSEQDRIEPKLAYVASFEPWEWIIGTGIYINDVDAIAAAKRNTTLFFTFGIAIITLLLIGLFANAGFVKPLENLINQVSKVGEGDFSGHVEVKSTDEIGFLANTINKMIQNLKVLLQSASETSEKVNESSESLAASSEEMSASLEEVASSTNEFSQNAQQLSDNSQSMAESSAVISRNAAHGDKAINDAVNQMQRITEIVGELRNVIFSLDERSQEIGKIVGTIKGIADQTNLLALNAAIEAARAGDQGRGFAVVADEVRKLAEQSASAASEITGLIMSTQEQSQKAVADMDKGVLEVNSGTGVIISTGEIFKTIVSGVDSIISQIESVAASSQQISSGSEEMSAAVEEQSATMEEVSASAFELRSAAEKLAKELARFTF